MGIAIRARIGLLSAAEIQEISSKSAAKLRSRKNYNWLTPDCIEDEVDKLPFSFSASLRRVMCRALSEKVSTFLLKRVADSLDLKLRGNRAEDKDVFLVHDFMFPFFLLEDHAGQLRHPKKEYGFWYVKPHKEWVDRAHGVDSLVAGMVDSFENEYRDWIHCGWITQISHADHPLKAKAYRVLNDR